MKRSVSLLPLAFVLVGCLSKTPLPDVRVFQLGEERAAGHGASAPTASGTDARPLHVASVEAAPPLDLAMVWRLSDVELRFDDMNRWADAPTELVRHRLERAIWAAPGLYVPNPNRPAAALFVEVAAFEGSLEGEPRARAVLQVTLVEEDGSRRLVEAEAEEPIPDRRPESLARGMGMALDACISEVLGEVVAGG